MRCPACGENNDEDAKFCYHCGNRLDQNPYGSGKTVMLSEEDIEENETDYITRTENIWEEESVNDSFPENEYEKTPTDSKKNKVIIIVEVIAIVVLVLFAIFANRSNSPEEIAERYFVNLANEDYTKAYKMLTTEESEFINKDALDTIFSEYNLTGTTSYEITDETYTDGNGTADSKKDADGIEYTITYQSPAEEGDQTLAIKVVKSGHKKMFFFDNWKIDSESLIANNATLLVPKEAKVSLDGVDLDEEYYVEAYRDAAYDYYTIPKMFRGIHKVELSLEGRGEEEKNLDVQEDAQESIVQLSLTEEDIANAQDVAAHNFKDIRRAVYAGDSFETISDLFSEASLEGVKESYDSFAYDIVDVGAQSATYTDVSTMFEGTVGEDTSYCEITLSYEGTKIVRDKEYPLNSSLVVQLVFEDGEWKQQNLER